MVKAIYHWLLKELFDIIGFLSNTDLTQEYYWLSDDKRAILMSDLSLPQHSDD